MLHRSNLRLSISGATAAAVLAVLLAYPGGIMAAYRDIASYSEMQERIEEDAVINSRLEAQTAAVASRIQIKEALIEELIHNRTSLAEVASRFHAMNLDNPTSNIVLESRYPGFSDEERAALNVIDFVRLREMPRTQKREVVQRILKDYQKLFGRKYSTIH